MQRLIAARKHADRVRRKRTDKYAAHVRRKRADEIANTAGWRPARPLDRT